MLPKRPFLLAASCGVAAVAVVAGILVFGALPQPTRAVPPGTVGSVDIPASEAVVATTLRVSGWALDPGGIKAVDVQMDGAAYPARYGLPRSDVAQVKPGYLQAETAGFEFAREFSSLSPIRHPFRVVARSVRGNDEILAQKSLIPPAAFDLWADLLPARSGDPAGAFHFTMATSGVSQGGAAEIDTQYSGYSSQTQRIGMAVPILYLRTTKGRGGDWEFDPDFDLTRKCGDRPLADDALNGVLRVAREKRIPVQFSLNGGIWADAACNVPEWDLNDHLEDDENNCQWTQDNKVYPDDYLKQLAGSTASPELARSLTYNVYATNVRRYKKRNLQAVARIIAEFARTDPALFVGVNLDADTYMNPFFEQREWFDYNPGTLQQFREWLRGTGPYLGKGGPGVPDLSAYRRSRPLTLAEVNRLARAHWTTWQQVDPPRQFPGSLERPLVPGRPIIWEDPWYQEWDTFRKHVIGLHYDELSQWAHEAGIDRDRIFSAQGFVAPAATSKPFATRLSSRGQNYDSGGVSIEGSIPRHGHLGAILYGPAAENRVRMEDRHALFATFARMDPGWAAVELNTADLTTPQVIPVYAQAYRSFRDLFNFDARQVGLMAWNGSNGIYVGHPGYVTYTSWRNTPAEDAMRDAMVSHANLPLGSRLWTFGSALHADDDGWTAEHATLDPGRGQLAIRVADETVALVSPPDQVIRPANAAHLVLGLRDRAAVDSVEVWARENPTSSWTRLSVSQSVAALKARPSGLWVPLTWSAEWRIGKRIAEQIKIVMRVPAARGPILLDRVALVSMPTR